MKKALTALAIAASAVGVTACEGAVKSGVVVLKHDRPAYTSIRHVPITTYGCHYTYGYHYSTYKGKYTYGYYNKCGTHVIGYRSVPDFHPEQWSPFELKNSKGKTGWVTVSSATYNATAIGDQYPNGGDG